MTKSGTNAKSKGSSSKGRLRSAKTGKLVAVAGSSQRKASSASKKIIEKSAERHKAALIRLADR